MNGAFHHHLLMLACLLGGASLQAFPERSGTVEEIPVPQDFLELEAAVTGILEGSAIPGASVVVIEEGTVARVYHYGTADLATGRPVDDSTIFRAGSISKSLTSIAALMLVEEGALRLDSELRTLLPGIELENPWAATAPVRLVHLLEHTAGFNDIAFRHYLLEGGGRPLAEAVEGFGPYLCRWPPGTRTSYTNQGPIVAARMLELAAGEPFEDFMQRRVVKPLGMTSATWKATPALAGRLAASYRPDGVTPERFIETPGWPSGGLNVTARDLARLPLFMLGRGRLEDVSLLSPEAVKRIETPQSSAAARAGLRHGYGLGNIVMPRGRSVFFGHDGSIDGFVATYAYAPSLEAGYVLMGNATSNALWDAAAVVRRYLERELPPIVVEPAPGAAVGADRWKGQYQALTPRRDLLAGLIALTQWEGASLRHGLLHFRGGVWVPVGGDRWQRSDEIVPGLVLFENGRSREIHTGMGAYRRVSTLEMGIKLTAGAGYLLLLSLALPHLALVAWAGIRGRLAQRGGAALRLWPMAALAAVPGVMVYALALLQTGDLEFLGRPTAAAWGLYAWSVLTPVLILAAATRLLWRPPSAGRGALILGWCYVAFAVLGCLHLAAHGWIGLQLWNA